MTDRRVTKSYLEVLAKRTYPPPRTTMSYLEVLVTIVPQRRVTKSYLEVLMIPGPDAEVLELSFESITGQVGTLTTSLPMDLTTLTEVMGTVGTSFPMDLETTVHLDADADGSAEFDGAEGEFAFETVTAVLGEIGVAVPILVFFSTLTEVAGEIATNAPLTFTTTTWVSGTVVSYIDGRRDLIDTRLYKR